MASSQPQTRRGVIRTVAAALGGIGLASTVSGEEAAEPTADQQQQPASPGTQRYNWYSGTVDRIVDGDHVVILLESGGRVVEQVVVDRSEFQRASEGDQVLVLSDGNEVASIVRL